MAGISGLQPWTSQSELTVKIKERKRDGVVILEMSGKLMGGPDADAFDEILKTLIHEGSKNVIVGMERVKWVNSTGLGILISSYTTLRNHEGELKLANVTDKIHSLLTITKLVTVFDAHDSVDEAIASFE